MKIIQRIVLLLFCCHFGWQEVLAEELPVVIKLTDGRTNFFADSLLQYKVSVTSTATQPTSVRFVLRTNERALATHTEQVPARAERELTIPLRLPPLNQGVMWPVELHVELMTKEQSTELAHVAWTLFQRDAFADRQSWLKEQRLRIFDPAEKQTKLLIESQLPIEPVHNLSALAEAKSGMLIIAEDLPWSDYPQLGNIVWEAAARGMHVICLASNDATIPMPLQKPSGLGHLKLNWRESTFISDLDARLNVTEWVPAQAPVKAALTLKTQQNRWLLSSVEPSEGWPWLDVHFPKTDGRLVYCGFAMLEHWETSPVPRYLLVRYWEKVALKKPF